jgi:hypothetical protein
VNHGRLRSQMRPTRPSAHTQPYWYVLPLVVLVLFAIASKRIFMSYVPLAVVLSVLFTSITLWRLSWALVGMHGRERVAQAAPIGRVFAVSRTTSRVNRNELLFGAVLCLVFPFGFALFTPDEGSIVLWIATALCAAISIAAVALDGRIRSSSR